MNYIKKIAYLSQIQGGTNKRIAEILSIPVELVSQIQKQTHTVEQLKHQSIELVKELTEANDEIKLMKGEK